MLSGTDHFSLPNTRHHNKTLLDTSLSALHTATGLVLTLSTACLAVTGQQSEWWHLVINYCPSRRRLQCTNVCLHHSSPPPPPTHKDPFKPASRPPQDSARESVYHNQPHRNIKGHVVVRSGSWNVHPPFTVARGILTSCRFSESNRLRRLASHASRYSATPALFILLIYTLLLKPTFLLLL